LIFEIEDYRQLAGFIQELYHDRSYIDRLGKNGNEKLHSELTFRVQGKKWEEIVESLLNGQDSNLIHKERVRHANYQTH